MLPIYLRRFQHRRVATSRQHGERSGGDYGVRRFERQALRLPHRPAWGPGQENLAAQAGRMTGSLLFQPLIRPPGCSCRQSATFFF
jgi:hypothetical protein